MKMVKVNKISHDRNNRGEVESWLLKAAVSAFYRWHFVKNVFIGQQTWGIINETVSLVFEPNTMFLANIRMFHYNVVEQCFRS